MFVSSKKDARTVHLQKLFQAFHYFYCCYQTANPFLLLFKLKLPQSPISIFSPSHLKELFATALDFLKLEKIELGGSRGKVLSEMVFSMSEEFHDRWRTIRESKYDPLDYTNNVRLWQLPLMSHCFVIKKPRGL